MSKPSPPTHLLIARHGYRLDTADRNWHLTSAEPYNPPLTYGGFTSTRNLGSRIASIVHSRGQGQGRTSEKRKGGKGEVRFIIHTSPYLRCVQTSLAIAEGIAQFAHQQGTNARYPGSDAALADGFIGRLGEPFHYQKPLVRVDAWLGEWLTPDYFEDISPPPDSRIVVAGTISELARSSSVSGNVSTTTLPVTPLSTSPLSTMAQVGDSSPSETTKSSTTVKSPAYTQLQPNWAIGSREPIPRGFVSHAKSYAEIDFGWDSFRFGDGGEYGEEWSTMQKRFRSGLGKLLEWYKNTPAEVTCRVSGFGKKEGRGREREGNPSPPLSDGEGGEEDEEEEDEEEEDEEEEDEVETIVVIVSHGGGCNAMLGALTDQPALTDVPIASLTMGVLSPSQPSSTSATATAAASTTPSSSIYLSSSRSTPSPLPLKYQIQLTNSTTHLRSGSQSQPSTQPPSRTSSISTRHLPGSSTSASGPQPPVPGSFTIISSSTPSSGLSSTRRTGSSSSTTGRNYLWSGIMGGGGLNSSRENTNTTSTLTPSSAGDNPPSIIPESAVLDEEDEDEDYGMALGGNLGGFGRRELERERRLVVETKRAERKDRGGVLKESPVEIGSEGLEGKEPVVGIKRVGTGLWEPASGR